MKKKFLPIDDSKKRFDWFLREGGLLGFAPISPQREARNQFMQGIIPPNRPRIAQLAGQVILQKQVDDYIIRVITGYDPVENKFTKAGQFRVNIATLSKKGKESLILTWKTTRTGDFLQRALWMMEMLSVGLENRPYDSSNRTLLSNLKEVADKQISRTVPFVWQDRKHMALVEAFILPDMLSPKVKEFFYKWCRSRWYYENVTRTPERKGYQRREREIRKPYKRGVRTRKK
jgi:hypothetical protein